MQYKIIVDGASPYVMPAKSMFDATKAARERHPQAQRIIVRRYVPTSVKGKR